MRITFIDTKVKTKKWLLEDIEGKLKSDNRFEVNKYNLHQSINILKKLKKKIKII